MKLVLLRCSMTTAAPSVGPPGMDMGSRRSMPFISRGDGHDTGDELHAAVVFLWPCIGVDGHSRPAWPSLLLAGGKRAPFSRRATEPRAAALRATYSFSNNKIIYTLFIVVARAQSYKPTEIP